MKMFLFNLSLLAFLVINGPTIAEENSCIDYGTIAFFQKNDTHSLEQCLEKASQEEITKIHQNGNNAPMNAVLANVDAVALSKVLSSYSEEELEQVFQHRNFEDLSIVHLASITRNGAKLLLELRSWGADFNVLKDKKEGSLF